MYINYIFLIKMSENKKKTEKLCLLCHRQPYFRAVSTGPRGKIKIVIFISYEAEKFGGIQHFCLMVEILSLLILWWQIHKSSEILTFD